MKKILASTVLAVSILTSASALACTTAECYIEKVTVVQADIATATANLNKELASPTMDTEKVAFYKFVLSRARSKLRSAQNGLARKTHPEFFTEVVQK